MEETTIYMKTDRLPRTPDMTRFYRFFESGHTCKIKVKPGNWTRRILCDCKVRYYHKPRWWYAIYLWIKNTFS